MFTYLSISLLIIINKITIQLELIYNVPQFVNGKSNNKKEKKNTLYAKLEINGKILGSGEGIIIILKKKKSVHFKLIK